MNKPATDRVVTAPATPIAAAPTQAIQAAPTQAIQAAPTQAVQAAPTQAVQAAWPAVDNSRATTTPVPASRHHAPPHPERRVQAQAALLQGPTAQFNQASGPSSRPDPYTPTAAYSATPYPAQPIHTPTYSPQAHPARPQPPESHPGSRPPLPYPAGQWGSTPRGPLSTYQQTGAGVVRMTTTTQRPHRRVDTSVLCAAAALILLALAVLVGLML